MNLLISLLLVFFVLVALLMVLVILMQRPKSEGLGASVVYAHRGTGGESAFRRELMKQQAAPATSPAPAKPQASPVSSPASSPNQASPASSPAPAAQPTATP
jgi:protein translocase SecG subunit